eukprot:scaffold20106_cov111-Isochrysis_galbana.AAC.5
MPGHRAPGVPRSRPRLRRLQPRQRGCATSASRGSHAPRPFAPWKARVQRHTQGRRGWRPWISPEKCLRFLLLLLHNNVIAVKVKGHLGSEGPV